MRHGDAAGGALAQRLTPDGLQFNRPPGFPVELARGFVVPHGAGARDLLVDETGLLRKAQFLGGGQDFRHQVFGLLVEGGVFQNQLGVPSSRTSGDAQAIEGNIPDQFVPTGGADGGGHGTVDPCGLKDLGEGAGPRGVAPGQVGEFDIGASHVAGNAGLRSGDANMTDSPQNPLLAGQGGEEFLVTESVLECADHRVGAQERRDQLLEVGVGRGLDADQDQVDGADLLGLSAGPDGMQVKVPVRAAHLDAVFPEMVEIPAGEKGDRDAGLGQLGAVVHPEGPGADHSSGG